MNGGVSRAAPGSIRKGIVYPERTTEFDYPKHHCQKHQGRDREFDERRALLI